MRYRVQKTRRTWLFILLAIVASGIIAYFNHRPPRQRTPEASVESGAHGGADGTYVLDVELTD